MVPAGLFASAGQALEPLQTSCGSQAPAEARQTVPADFQVQSELQHEPEVPFAAPSSHCSPGLMLPLPQAASVNVICAPSPEERPVTVSVKVTPMSKTSTVKSAFPKSPFASATDVSRRSGSSGGSSCRTMTTVSPGSQPLPVMTTVCPG